MKNTKAALNFPRACLSALIALFWLPSFDAQAQLDLQVTMAFNLKSTNELNATNSFWFDGILSQAVGVAADPSNCGPVAATSPLPVTIEADRGYYIQYNGIFCDAQVSFSGIPSCSRLYWDGVYAPDNIVYLPSEWCCDYHFSVVVYGFRGTVKFAPVCDPDFPSVPADKKTTVSPYLSKPNGWLTNNPTWSIQGDPLGCRLDITNNNPIITVSNKIGTITVRATDSDGICYVEGNLDLHDPDSGCSSGNCSSSSSPAGGGSTACSFGSGSFGLNVIDFRLGVGQSAEGHPSGFIRLYQPTPTTNIHFPAGLQFNYKRADVVVIRD